jgi:hypothetical protein
MKFKNFSLLGGLTGLLVILSSANPAQALQWSFQYSKPQAPSVATSGIITTSDTLNGDGSYDILAVSGQRNGISFSTLLPANTNLKPGTDATSDNKLFMNNYLAGTGRAFAGGFAFQDSGTAQFRFGAAGFGANYVEYEQNANAFNGVDAVDFQIAQVPFDFSPSQGALLGIPLFFSLRMLKKRKTSKLTESKALAASATYK